MIKLIAIGNPLMCDDGIGPAVAKQLIETLYDLPIQIIIAETDADSCFFSLHPTDYVIILDADYTGDLPGTIHVYELGSVLNTITCAPMGHDVGILELMVLYQMHCSGKLIGIEAAKILSTPDLSEELHAIFADICIQTDNLVRQIIQEV